LQVITVRISALVVIDNTGKSFAIWPHLFFRYAPFVV
jgi:hypothetical protein